MAIVRPHPCGQAGGIGEASGAEVWVPEKDKEAIADFAQVYEARADYYREVFLTTGIPEELFHLIQDTLLSYQMGITAQHFHRQYCEELEKEIIQSRTYPYTIPDEVMEAVLQASSKIANRVVAQQAV